MNSEADITRLATPLDGDAPSGPDLEYDADFMALERLVAPRGERVVGGVDDVDGPDWDRATTAALSLLERSRDLRLAVTLATAWLHTRGLPGWRDGLALVLALLDQLWGSVHPQLDAEDDDDPTARVNALMPLADPQGPLAALRAAPFVQSARLGVFNLRDLRIASGSLKPASGGDDAPASTAEIEACCLDCPEELLERNAAAVHEALAHARAIDALLTERLYTRAPEFKPLLSDLYELDRFLQAQWSARRGTVAEEVAGEEGDAASPAGGPVAGVPGRISGPSDVVRRIDEICDYYSRVEPSSPVPILLRRAQRLVGLGFEDILRNLAPAGLDELKVVAGASPE